MSEGDGGNVLQRCNSRRGKALANPIRTRVAQTKVSDVININIYSKCGNWVIYTHSFSSSFFTPPHPNLREVGKQNSEGTCTLRISPFFQCRSHYLWLWNWVTSLWRLENCHAILVSIWHTICEQNRSRRNV